MSKHTPGPWQWYWRTDGDNQADCGVYYAPRDGIAISVCRAPRYEKRGQWEANASLIAAAPDLLDALREALQSLEYVERMHGADITGGLKRLHDMQRARAAIAKAEGQ